MLTIPAGDHTYERSGESSFSADGVTERWLDKWTVAFTLSDKVDLASMEDLFAYAVWHQKNEKQSPDKGAFADVGATVEKKSWASASWLDSLTAIAVTYEKVILA